MTQTAQAAANTDYQPTAKELLSQYREFCTECDTNAKAKEEALNDLIDHLEAMTATPLTLEALQIPPVSRPTATLVRTLKALNDLSEVVSDTMYKAFPTSEAEDMLDNYNLALVDIQSVIGQFIGSIIHRNVCSFNTGEM